MWSMCVSTSLDPLSLLYYLGGPPTHQGTNINEGLVGQGLLRVTKEKVYKRGAGPAVDACGIRCPSGCAPQVRECGHAGSSQTFFRW